jgi:hypothetical protein
MAAPPPLPQYLVPATVSLDRCLDAAGHVGSARLDVLLPQGADAASLATLAARLCVATPRLLGREADVAAALAACAAPFAAAGAPADPQPRRVGLEVVAAADGAVLTDRVVVDLASPPGAAEGGAASLGAAVATGCGLGDGMAAAYAAALVAAIAAARAGGDKVLAAEEAAWWGPPCVERRA